MIVTARHVAEMTVGKVRPWSRYISDVVLLRVTRRVGHFSGVQSHVPSLFPASQTLEVELLLVEVVVCTEAAVSYANRRVFEVSCFGRSFV